MAGTLVVSGVMLAVGAAARLMSDTDHARMAIAPRVGTAARMIE
jgi:hypothetical protein